MHIHISLFLRFTTVPLHNKVLSVCGYIGYRKAILPSHEISLTILCHVPYIYAHYSDASQIGDSSPASHAWSCLPASAINSSPETFLSVVLVAGSKQRVMWGGSQFADRSIQYGAIRGCCRPHKEGASWVEECPGPPMPLPCHHSYDPGHLI